MGKLHKLPKRKIQLNTMYCADNLEVMKQLPAESIDLIYIDPPFCTQAVQKSKAWDNKVQVGSFDDKWGGGINSFILWLKVRLQEMHRLLKPTGSIFVHLDYRTVHYIKIELDRIFGNGDLDRGGKHLINEIIWCYNSGGKSKKTFPKKHDTILWYSKDKNKSINYDEVALPRDTSTMHEPVLVDENGKKYQRNIKNGKEYRYYLDKGVLPLSWWTDIQALNPSAKERLGYPTQKPLELMERIIKSCTDKKSVVADFFCGCGTTISAAHKLKRKWIGVDVSKNATAVIRKRMSKEHDLKIDITPLKSLTKKQVLSLDPFEFEKYAVRCIGGIPNNIQVSDGGIDGRMVDGTPIQVKKSDNIGRPQVDSFYKHLEHNGKGIIIAKSFNRGAKEEAARLLNEKGWELTLVTLDDLLRDHHGQVS